MSSVHTPLDATLPNRPDAPFQKPMTRWQAAGIHLGISAVVASLVMGVLFLIWYPSTYFTAMGGEQLVYLIVGCDIVLGPLITLVVYKHGKKSLTFDLAVIAAIQAGALVYGIMVAAAARPVYTVFVVDRFDVTAAYDIDKADLARVKDPRYASLPWGGPKTVAAVKPVGAEDQLEMIMSGMNGKDMNAFPHLSPAAFLLCRRRPPNRYCCHGRQPTHSLQPQPQPPPRVEAPAPARLAPPPAVPPVFKLLLSLPPMRLRSSEKDSSETIILPSMILPKSSPSSKTSE